MLYTVGNMEHPANPDAAPAARPQCPTPLPLPRCHGRPRPRCATSPTLPHPGRPRPAASPRLTASMAHRAGKSTSNGTSTHYGLGRVRQAGSHEVRGAAFPGSVWPTGYVRRYPGAHRVRAAAARDRPQARSVRSVPDRAGRARRYGTNGSGSEWTNPCVPSWGHRGGRVHAPCPGARDGGAHVTAGRPARSALRCVEGRPRVSWAGRSWPTRRERG